MSIISNNPYRIGGLLAEQLHLKLKKNTIIPRDSRIGASTFSLLCLVAITNLRPLKRFCYVAIESPEMTGSFRVMFIYWL